MLIGNATLLCDGIFCILADWWKRWLETHLIAAKVEWKLSCLRSNFFGSWWPWWGKNIERDCLLETRPLVTVRSNLYQPWMACKMNLINGNWDIQSNIFYQFNREFFKIVLWWPWWEKNIERDCLLATRPLITMFVCCKFISTRVHSWMENVNAFQYELYKW